MMLIPINAQFPTNCTLGFSYYVVPMSTTRGGLTQDWTPSGSSMFNFMSAPDTFTQPTPPYPHFDDQPSCHSLSMIKKRGAGQIHWPRYIRSLTRLFCLAHPLLSWMSLGAGSLIKHPPLFRENGMAVVDHHNHISQKHPPCFLKKYGRGHGPTRQKNLVTVPAGRRSNGAPPAEYWYWYHIPHWAVAQQQNYVLPSYCGMPPYTGSYHNNGCCR